MDLAIRNFYTEEIPLYFANENTNLIGYLRGDFGRKGDEFWSTWFDKNKEIKTPDFKAEFDSIVNELQKTMLKDLPGMRAYCNENWIARIPDMVNSGSYAFNVETERYKYCIRCTPMQNNYNFYIFCYKK